MAVSFFEGVVKDRSGQSNDIYFEIIESGLEFGNKMGCVCFKIDGKEYHMDDETGMQVVEAFRKAGDRIGYP